MTGEGASPSQNALARIHLVRHGQTSANTGSVWHGSTDTPLSDHGRVQADRVARHLALTCGDALALYSSPLERARHTAEAISAEVGLDVTIHPGLAEYDLGSWEGMSYAALASEKKLWENIRENPDFAPHGGESPRGVTERFCAAIKEIAETHPGGRVIAVAHGGVMALALSYLTEGQHGQWKGVMNNCAVSELVLEPSPRLATFNYTAHLEDD